MPSLGGSRELMGDSHNGGRISGHRVFSDVSYANVDRFDNDIEHILLIPLLALKATIISNKKLLFTIFGILLIIILLLVGKK